MTASVAIPALIANEIDAVQVSGAPVLTASLRGYDVVFVAGLLNTMIWNFYAGRKSQTSKRYAAKSSAPTGPPPHRLRHLVALKKLGLAPKTCNCFPSAAASM